MGAIHEVEHAAAHVLADAVSLDEAVPRLFRSICSALGWEIGVLWRADPRTHRLHCVELWRRPDERLDPFAEACRELTFAPGEGLPGRIWELPAPVWIPDVVQDLNFPRATAAEKAELHSAFGFPIIVRGEPFAVMEFFSYQTHDPDKEILGIVATIGAQIGQFAEREQLQDRIAFQNAILESQNEAALDGIVVVGPDARILYSNARFGEIWGIPQEVLDSGDDPEVFRHMMLKLADPDVFTELVGYLTESDEESRRDEIVLADGTVLDR